MRMTHLYFYIIFTEDVEHIKNHHIQSNVKGEIFEKWYAEEL